MGEYDCTHNLAGLQWFFSRRLQIGRRCRWIGTSRNAKGPIYTSQIRQDLAIQQCPAQSWQSIASSADGTKFVAVVYRAEFGLRKLRPRQSVNLTPDQWQSRAFPGSCLRPILFWQQSADLSGWANLTNQPVLNLTNLQNEISLPFSGDNFFPAQNAIIFNISKKLFTADLLPDNRLNVRR